MEQALSFEGTGLDLDNNYATINPGDSPFRLNCRYGTTDRSDLGGIQNFKGDTLVAKAFGSDQPFIQPDGENEVIGSCKDLERDAIIYFVWNDPGNPSLTARHQIRRYYTQTGEIQVILESPVLNFQRNHKIVHANVVDKYLSWTDGYENPDNEWDYNPPRQIDMELAYGYMLGLPWPQGYQTIDEQTLDAIRYAPNLCPTFQYVDDLNFNDNRLYGHLFQFGYRYVYYDNSRSVISPLSKLTLPQGEDVDGNYVLTVENRIDVTVETGHYTVKTIELVVKERESWKIVDTVDKYDESGQIIFGPTYTFEFFNTKFIAEIPIEEALRPFDYLPQAASAQEVISSQGGARRVYANYIEGYDNIDGFDLQATVDIEKIDNSNTNYKNISFKRKGAYQLGVVYSDKAGRKSFVQTGDSANCVIPDLNNQDLVAQYYDPNDEWILSTSQKPFINWQLNSAPPAWADSYQIVCTKDISNQQRLFTFMAFGSAIGDKEYGKWGVDTDAISIPPQIGYDFQSGDRIRIIAEFDNSNNQNVPNLEITGFSGITTNCKKLGEISPLVSSSNPYQLRIFDYPFDYKIKLFDPSKQLAILENSADAFFIQPKTLYIFEIYNPNINIASDNQIYYEVGESYPIVNGVHSVTNGKIDGIDIFVTNTKYELTPQFYKFQVDSFYERLADGGISSIILSTRFTPIVGVTASQNILREYVFMSGIASGYKNIQSSSSANSGTVTDSFDRPPSLSGSNNTYKLAAGYQWTFGLFEVYVSPSTGECSGTQEALSESTFAIKSPCRKIDMIYIPLERQSYSPYYSSEVDQTGRPYIINKEAVRRRYFANLIWGGQFFDNTLLNYFSRYESDSVLKLNEKFNEITRIQEVGFMLKVRQRNKSTSIYVGRTELTNADGSSNLAASNNVLGTINVSDEIWGGTNGTADCRSIRDTYFFDYINGTVVRDATNGLVAISGNLASQQDPFRMTAFFRDLSDWFKANEGAAEVVSTWDNHTQSVIFTLRSLIDKDKPAPDFIYKYKLEEAWNGGLTLSFHEPTNRWQTFHSYVREWYESIGNTLVSFNEGNLYLHYSNESRTEYMGVKYPVITAQICNQYTNNVKVFDNIDVYSNKKWRAEGSPIFDDIYILPNAQFVNGMRSKLSYNNFVGKEGKWHSTFLCDINTPGFSNTLLALMNGRRLRGEAMKVTLRNEDENEVFLRQVIFHFTPSELSGGGS
jgi:hypothetical protein